MSCLVREMFCFQDVGNSNILCSCELDNFRHSVELFRVNTGHLTFFFLLWEPFVFTGAP